MLVVLTTTQIIYAQIKYAHKIFGSSFVIVSYVSCHCVSRGKDTNLILSPFTFHSLQFSVLSFKYISESKGDLLATSTANEYMNKCMQVFSVRFGHVNGAPAHVQFFTGIQNNPGSNWYSKLRATAVDMEKSVKLARGEVINEYKSPPLYTHSFLAMQNHHCLLNTPEAINSSYIMNVMRLVWGRASEAASLAFEDYNVDDSLGLGYRRITVSVFQVKVSEIKPVPLVPGNDNPLLCPLIAAGDAHCIGSGNLISSSSTRFRHLSLQA